MKISLLRTLVAAFALWMAVPGQAAMAGDVGSGGEPGVQQEDAGVIFSDTPPQKVYQGIHTWDDYGHVGRNSIRFSMDNLPSPVYVRVQLEDAVSTDVSLYLYNQSASDRSEEKLELDSNNGVWIPSEYLNTSTSGLWGSFYGHVCCSTEKTVNYSVNVYSTQDINEPALTTSEHEVVFVEGSNFPQHEVSISRISGDLNVDIPLEITVDARGLVGADGFQLQVRPHIERGDISFSLAEEDLIQNTDGYYVYSIPSLQNKTYRLMVRATTECAGEVDITFGQENVEWYSVPVNVIIPINYSQSDIEALKAIAEANPMSTDLQKFIADKYYEKDYNWDDGYNVGVSWNTENPSRVREFILQDTREDRVDTLDLSALTALERIEINGSRIEKLNLSALKNLTNLYLYSTDLKWTDVTLPTPLPESFHASGNTRIEATGATPVDEYNAYAQKGTQIDLSAYATVNGTKSVYQWYKEDRETGNRTEVSMAAGSTFGAFRIQGTPGEYYYCEVTNPLYSNWAMRTATIKISRTSTEYSPIDTLALRKLAEDNPQVPQLKEFVDSKGWEHENWDTYSDGIMTDWSGVAPYRLTHLRIELDWGNEPDSISKLDLSAFTELKWFECERFMSISELDLSKNTKLEHLHVYSKNLASIDVSMCPNLKVFKFCTESIGEWIGEYNETKLNSINLSGCTKLETFKLEHAHVSSFDFAPYAQLREIHIENCQNLEAQSLTSAKNLEILSLPNTTQFGEYIQNLPASIRELRLEDTEYALPSSDVAQHLEVLGLPQYVETLDLAEYPNLRTLDVGYGSGESKLKYSQLKNYRSTVNYNGISTFELTSPSHPDEETWYKLFENGDTIDLSSEAVINGVKTQFVWVNAKYGTEEETDAIKEVEGRPGVFVLDSKEEKYGEYWCKIMNTQFCNITEVNSWNGWQMQTSNIRVNTLVPELFDQRDVQVIADIAAQAGEGTDLWNWWNEDQWMTGESYTWGLQAVWNNETPRRLVEWNLGYGDAYESTVETIDVSTLDRLEVLIMRNYYNLRNLVLPEETSSLRSLTIQNSYELRSLIVSPYTELEHLYIGGNYNLTACDVSNNVNLKTLRFDNTSLESIEITAPEIAAQLVAYGLPNNIETIDLNDFPALKQLYPNTSLMFSDVLNPRQMEPLGGTYIYGPMVGSVRNQYTPYGTTLSFPDEMSIAGVTSTVSWHTQDSSTGEDILLGSGNSYIINDDLEPDTYIQARIENSLFPGWVLSPSTWVYTCDGDANLDKVVNVADVTATVSWILNDQENMTERFGWAEADVNYDNVVEVADVIGIVNIIQGKPVTKASELRDAYQPTVLLELDDKGFLSMTSQVPVAGIQLEFTGATKEIPLLSDAAHLVQASTLNGDTLRTLGYSMDGKTIPAGKTVIMQLPAGVKLLKAVFSDAEANSLKAEGDIVPTGIESIQTADQIEAVLNYPNPFSGSTTFSYVLKEQAQSVAIQIFSTSGALVETIEGLPASVGTNRYTTSVQLPGGIYYYRLLLDGKKASEANTMMIK